jgi:acyl-CoA synthetase (AMP-forming)/AMP-acid ligase II
VRDGERVGILALNSDRFAELLLAVPWANGVLSPINVRWTPAEIIPSLTESGTDILFVDETYAPVASVLTEGYPGLRTIVHMGDAVAPTGMLAYEDLIRGTQPVDDARRSGSALAGLFYTGGSSGFPKGVMLSAASLLTTAVTVRATVPSTVAPGGRMLLATPMFHLGGVVTWLLQSICGGTHVMIPEFEPGAIVDAIERDRVTHTFLVPALLQQVLDHPAWGERDLSSLETLIYGGSPIGEPLLERAMKALPHTSFVQIYAMTEHPAPLTFLTPEDHCAAQRLRSAGRAGIPTDVRIVDSEDNEVPRGSVGEIVCRSDGVMLGYWAKPGDTAEALRGGWMHTGDAGYMDDAGYVHIVDRIKDVIITGGANVYAAEVENAISSHPAVAACAVIGVPDAEWGERVHAVIVPMPGQTVGVEEIREHCSTRIAVHKAPRSCDLVDALPLSPLGKPLRRELRKPFWATADRNVN